jgi:copper chaperone CopZ
MTTQHFELKNLKCSSCVMHLEGLEEDAPGIHKVDADFKSSRMKVEFDESRQSVEGISLLVSDMGYVAIPFVPAESAGKSGSIWSRLRRS